MTPDGRYVAFVSSATNLVAHDTNGIPDVFVRDLQTGVTVLASPGARLVSASSSSESPDLTPDGRYVAFYSTATNLAAGATNAQEIYVRDLTGGTTIWASTGARAAALSALKTSKIVCYNHAISADSKFVVYEASPTSDSSPIFPGLILRYSLDTGLTDLVHTNAAIEAATGGLDIRNLDMTPDGQRIVFVASTNGTSGATTCILVWDAATGTSSLVSGDLGGKVVTNATCDWPTIDPTGRFVAFSSTATNLTTNTLLGPCHLYLGDLSAGTTTLLDADSNGVGSFIGPLTAPCLSSDARFVAFECADGNLVPNDRNRNSDVIVRDLTTGTHELVSARHATLASLTPNGPSMLSTSCVSTDGRSVAFASDADNLVTNDTNSFRDVFVRDQVSGTNFLVSVGTNAFAGDGISFEPAMSADGRYVAFTSQAGNLVAGDLNATSDVFVRDLQTGVTTMVSVNNVSSGSGNAASYSPAIASGGRYVLFRSKATNLAPGSFSGAENLFLRDRQAGTNFALTTAGLSSAAMTPDGRFVAFVGSGKIYVWGTAAARNIYTNSTSVITNVAISSDGNRIAYWTGASPIRLFATDLAGGTSWTISSNPPASHPGMRFSADNRFLAYAAAVNKTNQVYLYDFLAATNISVSVGYNPAAPGNDSSDSPDISSDGRFVAYRSAANNLVPSDTNGVPDIFLFDRPAGATTLLSASYLGSFAANNRSLCPVFSGDGQTLVFQTWASDLVGADFNQTGDVVACSVFPSGSISLFYVTIFGSSSQGPWLTWPAVPGKSYRVQFKTNLSDTWQELGGNVTIVGNQGYCQDIAPATTRRFYRIVGQ
jgi:Tol biopolymer transport system component